MEKCFSCNKEKRQEICEHCGYSFTLPWECPRLIGNICANTKKVCPPRNKINFEQCPTLRANE